MSIEEQRAVVAQEFREHFEREIEVRCVGEKVVWPESDFRRRWTPNQLVAMLVNQERSQEIVLDLDAMHNRSLDRVAKEAVAALAEIGRITVIVPEGWVSLPAI
jgi:hypothetical protein